MRRARAVGWLCGALTALAAAPPSALAATSFGTAENQWMPSTTGAEWVYAWSDDTYAPTPTTERYVLSRAAGAGFSLRWTTADLGNPDDAVASEGLVDYQRSDGGLVNLNWNGTVPPPQFPILCAGAASCANTLAGTQYMVIWGARASTLVEPLLKGTAWSTVGGAGNDVVSVNRYVGAERVVVPAFPEGVPAARVDSEITQAGAIGDPYGSGVRTVWWVRGVGPVKVLFRHTGGALQQSALQTTNLSPVPAPPDADYLPFVAGQRQVFRWRNSRHMRAWSRQQLTIGQTANNTTQVDVKSLSGPLRTAGSYIFAKRLSGVTNLALNTASTGSERFPALGPTTVPASRRRHLLTPLDFLTYGLNPVLPAYPSKGQTWAAATSGRDFAVYGVRGASRVAGFARVKVPAGSFNALAVRSTLTQKGVRYGSGVRTAYFAAGRGLVKLTFRHADGSVSTVERVK